MTIELLLLVAIFLLGLAALIGFFYTKTEGFGRFTTSTFLILLVLVMWWWEFVKK